MHLKKISTRVRMSSLVGIMGTPPVSFGNYCSVREGYLINLWAENLDDLVSRGILGRDMTAWEVDPRMFFVIDDRIPPEYLHNDKPCFTGGYGMTTKGYNELYRYLHPELPLDTCVCYAEASCINFVEYNSTEKVKKGLCRICGREVIEPWDPPSAGTLTCKWTTTSEMLLSSTIVKEVLSNDSLH